MKPCPFCGGKEIYCQLTAAPNAELYRATCKNCSSQGPAREHVNDAIDAWNKRPVQGEPE